MLTKKRKKNYNDQCLGRVPFVMRMPERKPLHVAYLKIKRREKIVGNGPSVCQIPGERNYTSLRPQIFDVKTDCETKLLLVGTSFQFVL